MVDIQKEEGKEMEELTIMWLIILVVMVIIEIATMGLTTIWFAGGAAVAFLLDCLEFLLNSACSLCWCRL